jgi:hypothetical protein
MLQMKSFAKLLVIFSLPFLITACSKQPSGKLTDDQVEDIVNRSYQYVALYNVNNKGAIVNARITGTSGWNICVADTALKDHNLKDIARPNNDTKYLTCMLDLRAEPIIIQFPAFDSKYVSLMCTAYDHYVNVPMATRVGDFRKPENVLFYTARTEGYKGDPVEGVDRIFEMSGDFVSAVLRVMPHANEPERFKKINAQMKAVKAVTLSGFKGETAKPVEDPHFPSVGITDGDVFGNNLPEVMQFVFNHLTFDPQNEMDNAVLAVYKPLGIVPGQQYDSTKVAKIDGEQFRRISEKVKKEQLALLTEPSLTSKIAPRMLRPKGQTDLEAILAVSVIGPIGLPMEEAMYPNVTTTDGKPMNAMNDYVIRMSRDEMPPANAFWSLTLYDTENGFFIPNDRKKYSVGENGGMKLNDEGGIEIYIAAQKPAGVPEENWLPLNRGDYGIDATLRLYVPDLEKFKSWQPPKAEVLK